MNQSYFFVSLLISGPNALVNDIDIYLQPFIEELKELWEIGVETYDKSKKEMFQLRACLLWTVSDFPAYANLSGWSTKGKYVCPCCQENTDSLRLTHCHKFCYMGHRRWLPIDHSYRKSKKFNGKEEHRHAPEIISALETSAVLDGVHVVLGKGSTTIKRKRSSENIGWRKKSIFFELSYWKSLLLCHNIDVMHVEKNVCDSLLGTILNLDPKIKGHLNSRLDLQELNI